MRGTWTKRLLTPLIVCCLAACGGKDGAEDPADAEPGEIGSSVPDTGPEDAAVAADEDVAAAAPRGEVVAIDAPLPFLSGSLPAESAVDESDRPRFALDGTWRFRFDDDELGVGETWFAVDHDRAAWDDIAVPAAWDLAVPDGYDRQTVAWYAREVAPPDLGPVTRLRFEGVFREARVWWNGEDLGGMDLPYLPFGFDVSARLAASGSNTLVVRIDNRLTSDTLPCDTLQNAGKHGWFPFGGLTRPVYLAGARATHVVRARISGDPAGGRVSADVLLSGPAPASGTTTVDAWVGCAGETVLLWDAFALDEGQTAFGLRGVVPEPRPWSPETPDARYRLRVRVTDGGGGETVAYDFALKTFVAESGRFLLNGTDRFLRGINRHEDHPEHGSVFDEEVVARDVELIDRMGADFCRPGHYPNDVRVLRALEAAGVMLAEEIPVYQLDDRQLADPVLVDRATRALERLITRDANRPGVVMWSISNEIWAWSAAAPAFLQALYDTAKALDPARPVMIATVTAPFLSELDRSSGVVDVIGLNEYFGWYYGTTAEVGTHLDTVHALFPDRTWFISEYGAGALHGRHQDEPPGEEDVLDHSYSEEYQRWFHEQHLAAFAERDFVRGVMPWVFSDFRMQWTPHTGDPHPADRTNLKGLVSAERVPKASYDLLSEWYGAR